MRRALSLLALFNLLLFCVHSVAKPVAAASLLLAPKVVGQNMRRSAKVASKPRSPDNNRLEERRMLWIWES